MPRPEPMTYQRGATGIVRGRLRLTQAGEELRIALAVLDGTDGGRRSGAMRTDLRPSIERLLARVAELERTAAEVGRRW